MGPRRHRTTVAFAGAAVICSAAIALAAWVPAAAPPPSPATAVATTAKNAVAPAVSAPAQTTTTVSGTPNPVSFTAPATSANVTITAVVSSELTVNEGAVTFTDGTTALGSSPVTNGVAVLLASFGEGTHQILATYKDSGTQFTGSQSSFDLRVNAATTNPSFGLGSGPYTYCNSSPITVPASGSSLGPASPYPSNIFVTNLPGTVNQLTITFNGFGTDDQGDLLSLLVGPGGNNLDFFSLTGSSVTFASGPLNLTFSDSAGSFIPQGSTGNLSSSGSFKATSFNTNIAYPQCPFNATFCASPPVGPPLPTNPFTPNNKAAVAGTSVLGNANEAGVFGGTSSSTYNGNGTWSLYLDDGGPTSGHGEITNLNLGWCLNITTNQPSVLATKSHSETFTQGQQNVPFLINLTNNGPGSTGDPTGGNNPLTVTDTLNAAFSFAGFSGTGWNCSAVAQTVTCQNDSAVPETSSYSPLTINVNVSPNASTTTAIPNSVSITGAGAIRTTSNTDAVTILPAAVLAITKSHTGTFTQGQTAQWNLTVANTAASGMTNGTITVEDSLVPGFTLASYSSSSSAWTCTGTNVVTCTTTEGISAGANSTIELIVNVPANSPTSVTNIGVAFGGGDLIHTSAGTAAVSNGDTVSVASSKPSATVVSYSVLFGSQSFNLIGSARNRLPWEITGVQVVFSQPITTANVNSLAGVTTTGFSGLGTATLTWNVAPIPIGAISTTLLATGPNAIKDVNGNALSGGAGFVQNFKVLWGDFNDDGVVSASDAVLVNAARSGPYNIFADANGDGLVNATDVTIVRGRIGTSQP